MPVRSDSLAVEVRAVAFADALLYTCPAGTTTLVKDIRLQVKSSAVASAEVALARGAARYPIVFGAITAAINETVFQSVGFVVMEPGDQLRWTGIGAVAPTFSVVCSGAELAGLAP